MKDYTQIPNAVYDSEIWKNPEWFRAYCDIMRRVWREDSKDGKTKRGEVYLTIGRSAMRWGWSKTTTFRFVSYLVDNNWLKRSNNQSVYSIWNTKSNILGNEKRNAKNADSQEESKKTRNDRRNGKRNEKRNGTPIIGENEYKEKNNKGDNAVGSGHATAAPPAPGVNEDGLPYGVTRKQWDQFKAWAETAIPTLWEVGITPTDFRSMRNGSLNNREKFTAILTTMEKAGKPHSVRDEFYRRLDRWEQDKFNGMYG